MHKSIRIIAAAVICLAVLPGCRVTPLPVLSAAPAPTRPAFVTIGIELSKEARITGYLIGQPVGDMPLILEEVNKKLKRDINATLELNYIKWGELQVKYQLLLASGADIDWIFTSNWNYYHSEAARGSFLELTRDMLEKYMPLHLAATDDIAWKQAAIDGKVYMIPTATPDEKYSVAIIREDLRKKFNVPEMNRLSDLGPYLAAVKANCPDITPMMLGNGYDITAIRRELLYEQGYFAGEIGSSITYEARDANPAILSYMDEPVYTYLKQACGRMKSWYDAGYINANPFSNEVRSKESFQKGLSAVGFGNLYDVSSNIVGAEKLGYQVRIIPLVSTDGTFARDPYIINGAAIVSTSKNPERAMMCLDLIMEDPAYNYLVSFGIEGRNYSLTNDGRISVVESPEGAGGFVLDQTGFWFTNKKQWKPIAEWPQYYVDMREHARDRLFDDPLVAFAFDNRNVKPQYDQIASLFKYQLDPIVVGAVPDVDAALDQFREKARVAGIDTVKAAVAAQVVEYLR